MYLFSRVAFNWRLFFLKNEKRKKKNHAHANQRLWMKAIQMKPESLGSSAVEKGDGFPSAEVLLYIWRGFHLGILQWILMYLFSRVAFNWRFFFLNNEKRNKKNHAHANQRLWMKASTWGLTTNAFSNCATARWFRFHLNPCWRSRVICSWGDTRFDSLPKKVK